MADSEIVEGKWRCAQCSRVNRGTVMACKGCGKTRGDEEFFLDESDAPVLEIITSDRRKEETEHESDWVCNYCSTSNAYNIKSCGQCGASKDGKHKPVKKHDKRSSRRQDSFVQEPHQSAPEHGPNYYYRNDTYVPPKKTESSDSFWTPNLKIAGIVIGILLVCGLIFMACNFREEVVTVSGQSWLRTAYVERSTLCHESCWEGDIPVGAKVTSTESKFHHNEKVPNGTKTETYQESVSVPAGTERYCTGTTNLGNGKFRKDYSTRTIYKTEYRTRTRQVTVYKDVPVYRTYIYYDIQRWKEFRNVSSAGNQTTQPVWPNPNFGDKERAGRTEESYTLFLTRDEGKEPRVVSLNVNYADYCSWPVGSKGKASMYGSATVSKLQKFETLEK